MRPQDVVRPKAGTPAAKVLSYVLSLSNAGAPRVGDRLS